MTKTEAKAILSRMATMQVKLNRLTRQRDAALGRAREYRGYASKYQRELAELRRFVRGLK